MLKFSLFNSASAVAQPPSITFTPSNLVPNRASGLAVGSYSTNAPSGGTWAYTLGKDWGVTYAVNASTGAVTTGPRPMRPADTATLEVVYTTPSGVKLTYRHTITPASIVNGSPGVSGLSNARVVGTPQAYAFAYADATTIGEVTVTNANAFHVVTASINRTTYDGGTFKFGIEDCAGADGNWSIYVLGDLDPAVKSSYQMEVDFVDDAGNTASVLVTIPVSANSMETLFGANLVGHWDNSRTDLTTVNGSNQITAQTGPDGSTYAVSGSYGPTLVAAAQNGLSVARYDGTARLASTTAALLGAVNFPSGAAAPVTFIWAGKITAPSGSGTALFEFLNSGNSSVQYAATLTAAGSTSNIWDEAARGTPVVIIFTIYPTGQPQGYLQGLATVANFGGVSGSGTPNQFVRSLNAVFDEYEGAVVNNYISLVQAENAARTIAAKWGFVNALTLSPKLDLSLYTQDVFDSFASDQMAANIANGVYRYALTPSQTNPSGSAQIPVREQSAYENDLWTGRPSTAVKRCEVIGGYHIIYNSPIDPDWAAVGMANEQAEGTSPSVMLPGAGYPFGTAALSLEGNGFPVDATNNGAFIWRGMMDINAYAWHQVWLYRDGGATYQEWDSLETVGGLVINGQVQVTGTAHPNAANDFFFYNMPDPTQKPVILASIFDTANTRWLHYTNGRLTRTNSGSTIPLTVASSNLTNDLFVIICPTVYGASTRAPGPNVNIMHRLMTDWLWTGKKKVVAAAPNANAYAGVNCNYVGFSDNANGGATITSHTIQRSTTAGAETTLAATYTGASPYQDTTAAAGTAYFYKVIANNIVGPSPASAEVTATPVSTLTVPGAPTITLTPNDGLVVVTIADGVSGGAVITQHKIYDSTTSGSETLLTTISSGQTYTITGLTDGTPIFVKASSVNSAGEGARSAEQSATPVATPKTTPGILPTQDLTNFNYVGYANGTSPTITTGQVDAAGGNTGAKLVFPNEPASNNYSRFRTIFSAVAGGAVTAEMWLKGAVGGESVVIGFQDQGGNYSASGTTTVTLTTTYQRFTVTGVLEAGVTSCEIHVGTSYPTAAETIYTSHWNAREGSHLRNIMTSQSLLPTSVPHADFDKMIERAKDQIMPILERFEATLTTPEQINLGQALNGALHSLWTHAEHISSRVLERGLRASGARV